MSDNDQVVKNQKEWFYWLDWAKAIGIYLVVLGHIHYLRGTIYIYMFHMPYFFMLLGYLYKPHNIKVEFSRSFKSLLVPYLFFNIVLLLIAACIGEFDVSMIRNILLCNYEVFPVRYFAPLWFLVSLFLMRMYCSAVGERHYIISLVLFLVISIVLFYFNLFPGRYDSDYFQLATTCIFLPSFLFGWMIKEYNLFSLIDTIKPFPRYTLLAIMSLIMIVLGKWNGFVDVYSCRVGKNIILYYLVGTTLSFNVIYVFSKVFNVENRIIKTVSIGTVLILGLHTAMIDGLSYCFPKNSYTAIIISFVIMVICYPLIIVTLKYCPFLIGRKKLNKT